jgi:hypothetical protein
MKISSRSFRSSPISSRTSYYISMYNTKDFIFHYAIKVLFLYYLFNWSERKLFFSSLFEDLERIIFCSSFNSQNKTKLIEILISWRMSLLRDHERVNGQVLVACDFAYMIEWVTNDVNCSNYKFFFACWRCGLLQNEKTIKLTNKTRESYMKKTISADLFLLSWSRLKD